MFVVTSGEINMFKVLLVSKCLSNKSSSMLSMDLNWLEENEQFILTYLTMWKGSQLF